MSAIIKRELQAYFTSPIAYVVISVFFFFSGLSFQNLLYYDSANISYVFSSMFTIMLFVLPILTMRLLSEEKKQKTDQALLTAPISVWQIVTGKYVAAEIIFLLSMVIYLPMTIVIASFTAVQWGMIFCNLLGMFLLGSALIAIGLFVSSITESQIVAAVGGIAIGLFINMMDSLTSAINIDFITDLINSISFMNRFQNFYSGIINLSDLVFYISVVFLFIFITTRIIDRKRWS